MYKTPFKVKYDSVVIGNDMLAFWLAIKTPLLYAKLDLLRKDWFFGKQPFRRCENLVLENTPLVPK